jgi:hypothetical protein
MEKIVEFTDFIYENSLVKDLSVSIEGIDTDKYEVLKTNNKLRVKFGKFNSIFKKKIKLTVMDSNKNAGSQDIDFEVYTPIPGINLYKDNIIS